MPTDEPQAQTNLDAITLPASTRSPSSDASVFHTRTGRSQSLTRRQLHIVIGNFARCIGLTHKVTPLLYHVHASHALDSGAPLGIGVGNAETCAPLHHQPLCPFPPRRGQQMLAVGETCTRRQGKRHEGMAGYLGCCRRDLSVTADPFPTWVLGF